MWSKVYLLSLFISSLYGITYCLLNKHLNKERLILLQLNYVQRLDSAEVFLKNQFKNVSISLEHIDQIKKCDKNEKQTYFAFSYDLCQLDLLFAELCGTLSIYLYGYNKQNQNNLMTFKKLSKLRKELRIVVHVLNGSEWTSLDFNGNCLNQSDLIHYVRVKNLNSSPLKCLPLQNGSYRGIECQLMNFIAENLVDCDGKDVFQKSEIESVFGAKTGDWNNDNEQFFSLPLYYQDDLTWCVNRISSVSQLKILCHFAAKCFWFAMCLIIMLNYVIVIFFKRNDRYTISHINHSFTEFIRDIFGNFSNENHSILFKYLFVMGILFTINWNIILIKSVFRPTSFHQVQTTGDLIKSDYRLVGNEFAQSIIEQNQKVSLFLFI